MFPFIFIFHILANFGKIWRLFSEEKMGILCQNIPFFTFWRNLAKFGDFFQRRKWEHCARIFPFIFILHILAKFGAKNKTLRFSVPSFQHPVE
jgi:hypothetical protein